MSDDEKDDLEDHETYCDVHSVFHTKGCPQCLDAALIDMAVEVEGIPAGGIFDTPGGGPNPRLVVTGHTDPRVTEAGDRRRQRGVSAAEMENSKRIDQLNARMYAAEASGRRADEALAFLRVLDSAGGRPRRGWTDSGRRGRSG